MLFRLNGHNNNHIAVGYVKPKKINADYNPARSLIAAADKLADEVLGYGFMPQNAQTFAVAG